MLKTAFFFVLLVAGTLSTSAQVQKPTHKINSLYCYISPLRITTFDAKQIADSTEANHLKLWVLLDAEDTSKIRGFVNWRKRSKATTVTELWPTGNKKKLVIYKNGKLESQYEEYHPNGYYSVWGQYKKGKKVGHWVYFDSKGYVSGKETYKKGVVRKTKSYYASTKKMFNKARTTTEKTEYILEWIDREKKE